MSTEQVANCLTLLKLAKLNIKLNANQHTRRVICDIPEYTLDHEYDTYSIWNKTTPNALFQHSVAYTDINGRVMAPTVAKTIKAKYYSSMATAEAVVRQSEGVHFKHITANYPAFNYIWADIDTEASVDTRIASIIYRTFVNTLWHSDLNSKNPVGLFFKSVVALNRRLSTTFEIEDLKRYTCDGKLSWLHLFIKAANTPVYTTISIDIVPHLIIQGDLLGSTVESMGAHITELFSNLFIESYVNEWAHSTEAIRNYCGMISNALVPEFTSFINFGSVKTTGEFGVFWDEATWNKLFQHRIKFTNAYIFQSCHSYELPRWTASIIGMFMYMNVASSSINDLKIRKVKRVSKGQTHLAATLSDEVNPTLFELCEEVLARRERIKNAA